jgi:enoyl-CoA hydratase/carnithine racemase
LSSSSNAAAELASGKLLADEPAPRVLRLRISNPAKRGALDHEILDALGEAVAGASDARCLVITGDGPVFSAGYDIGNFSDEQTFAEAAEKLVAHPFVEAMDAIEAFPYPVIAAINGHAIGGGLELAVTCDIRIAARGVRLGMPPAKIGLIYGHTGLRRFVEVCGLANTNELFYVGRNVDADRAYDMNLVNRVVEPDDLGDAAADMAAEIAANSPLSLEGNKRILRTMRSFARELPDDVERELVELRESCFRTEDFREGIKAFGEKRRPEWKGR